MTSFSYDTFAGGNTPQGFYSFFEELKSPLIVNKAYIIKGGPGTGKSTLMKKIANIAIENGYITELLHCSSDINSLDAVYIKDANAVIVDGTSPHALEASYPGAVEKIINVGDAFDYNALMAVKKDIITLTSQNKSMFVRVYRLLGAAGRMFEEQVVAITPFINTEKLRIFTKKLIISEIPKYKSAVSGIVYNRFLSAFSDKGVVTFTTAFENLCKRVYLFNDRFGIMGETLSEIANTAQNSGFDTIRFSSIINPERIDHLIIPEIELGFYSNNGITDNYPDISFKTICADRFLNKANAKSIKQRIGFSKKVMNLIIEEASSALSQAKRIHDKLESFYIQNIDFNIVDNIFEQVINELKIKNNNSALS